MPHVGLILLAAGSSSRMGRPKQLLVYRGESLLRRAARTAVASLCRPVLVVLGSSANAIIPELANLDVEIVHNAHWEQGMGSSIACGIRWLIDMREDVDAAIVMLCDQPMITPESIDAMTAEFAQGAAEIIATDYGCSAGVPALFARSQFAELLGLDPVRGAKFMIESHSGVVRLVNPSVKLDIDLPEDYDALMARDSFLP